MDGGAGMAWIALLWLQALVGMASASFSYQSYLADVLPRDQYVIDGDLTIGLINRFRLLNRRGGGLCAGVDKDMQETLYSIKYALELINQDPALLPNTTLGLHALDTCQWYSVPIPHILRLISTPEQGPFRGPLSLNITPSPLAVLSPLMTGLTSLSTVYGIPLVSPLGSQSTMVDREAFPYIFGVTPVGDNNHRTMLEIAHRFNWKYVSLFYSFLAYGIEAYKYLHLHAPRRGICIAASVMTFPGVDYTAAAMDIVKANASVLFLMSGDDDVRKLFLAMDALGHTSQHYIMLMSPRASFSFYSEWHHRLQGSIRFEYIEETSDDLWNYMQNVWPGDETQNSWMQDLWHQNGWDATCTGDSSSPCHNLTQIIDPERKNLLNRGVSAMYAVAQAIHDAVTLRCPQAFGDVGRIMSCVTPMDVASALKEVIVQTPTRRFQFNPSGDTNIDYNLYQEQGTQRPHIGIYRRTRNVFEMNVSALSWGSAPWVYDDEGIPIQVCSFPCHPSEFYLIGDLPCCWTCHSCRIDEIVINNQTSCAACPLLQWPKDEYKQECAFIPLTYLNWTDIYGLILTSLACGGLLLTLGLTATVRLKSDLRVIKGAGVQMLYIILIGLGMAFTTVFAHITRPSAAVCLLSRVGFNMAFTLIFGPMLVKTNRIFQVFLAASKLSRNVFMGSERSQQIALGVVLLLQVGLTVLSLVQWPAEANIWMPARAEKYVELYCEVPRPSTVLGASLNLLLAMGCSILAFAARSLPDNFNESWYIFMSVTTTLAVWLAFFTSYYSAFYQLYRSALLAGVLIMNSLVIIFALFGPKVYAVLFVEDANVQISNFEGTMSRGGGTSVTNVDVSTTAELQDMRTQGK